MRHSDLPWRRDYWVGEIDPRPLALLRVVLGLVMLQDLATRIPDLFAFLGDDGMLPRGVQAEPWAWSLFDLVGSPFGVGALFACGVVTAALFTVGYRTRWMTLLAWLFTQSLQNRNLFIGDGGDDLLRVMLFWALFTDLGAVWSLDARRSGGRYAPALGARLLQMQVALVYLAAGFNKVRGAWLDPDMVFQSMQHLGYLRPPGEWLLSYPGLCRVMNHFTLVAELGCPWLLLTPLFIRPARALGIALSVALQAGLFITMRVGIWTGLLLLSSVLFLLPSWLDAMEAWCRRRGLALPEPTPLAPASWPSAGRPSAVMAVAAVVQFLLTGIAVIRTPVWLDAELKWIGLNQGLDLFSRPIEVRRWRAPGVLENGQAIEDILPLAQPELQPSSGFLFSRWTKFTFKRNPHYPSLGRYLCRSYAQRAEGPALISFTLLRDIHAPRLPDAPPPAVRTEVLWEQRCGE